MSQAKISPEKPRKASNFGIEGGPAKALNFGAKGGPTKGGGQGAGKRAGPVEGEEVKKKKLSLVERPQMKIAFGFSAKGSDRVEELAVQWSRLQ